VRGECAASMLGEHCIRPLSGPMQQMQ